MFEGLPKSKKMNYLGHLNDISLFLEAAGRHAPSEAGRKAAKTNKDGTPKKKSGPKKKARKAGW
jgi:hypothetical protein